jgi:hypothetical protein
MKKLRSPQNIEGTADITTHAKEELDEDNP